MDIQIDNERSMLEFGRRLGSLLKGGEVIELVGDIGAGKTTLVKGLALGMGIDENVQSPSFTINFVYRSKNDINLAHYDFYRLQDAGIMQDALAEMAQDSKTVTAVEWAGIVDDVLPKDRLTIKITVPSENTRAIQISAGGDKSRSILEGLK